MQLNKVVPIGFGSTELKLRDAGRVPPSSVIPVQTAILPASAICLAATVSEPAKSATVGVTLNTRSCARAISPMCLTAISSVRVPESSKAHCLRIKRGGMRVVVVPRL